jgi:hypothetical protein
LKLWVIGLKWTEYLIATKDTHPPEIVHEYIASGTRNVGRPKEKWTNSHEDRKSPKSAYNCLLLLLMMMMMTHTAFKYI